MPLSGDRPDPDCAHNYFALNQNAFAGARRLISRKNGVEYQSKDFLSQCMILQVSLPYLPSFASSGELAYPVC